MGPQEDGSATRQQSDKLSDCQLFDTTCKVIQPVYQEKVLLTLSENYMWSTFWVSDHHQGWFSTLR